MRNIAVKIRFLGKDFHGFQTQQNALAIEDVITDALFKILGEKTQIFGCSRTDSGVSAYEYVFNFKTENKVAKDKIKSGLNHFLPDSIAVYDVQEVEEGFHARYSCIQKEYEYVIYNSRQKDPFCEGRTTRYSQSRLDEALLDSAAKAFLGEHDFSAFCSANDGVKTHTRCIKKAEVTRRGDLVYFNFCADGFLYNMVRIMVGTLIFVNEGKIKKEDIPKIIKSKNRKMAGKTAEPDGLYLKKVYYKEKIFEE